MSKKFSPPKYSTDLIIAFIIFLVCVAYAIFTHDSDTIDAVVQQYGNR